ncbi:hypothetical protein FD754_007747 [Muntiacus muntjak]|uniref:RBPJ-interacting and tubulin-associated protein 1 n=1 Tax=Muntiacus muntjak TaxID=9888 RepID=A0A5N3WPH4_MUNMU|nr:hypothetical protein FD754_007747 [Muntiacus muntjak]
MKTPAELAISWMQTLHIQHRCGGGYQIKVRPSYVEEILFGSPAGTWPTPPAFDPPWKKKANRTRGVGTGVSQASGANGSCESTSSSGSTPTLTPRKNKYRSTSQNSSYCDAAKLHALFRITPAIARGSHSPHPRETPARAVHPAGPQRQSAGWAIPTRSPTYCPWYRSPPASTPCTDGPRDPRPAPSGVTFWSPLVTASAPSVSVSVPAMPPTPQGGATQKAKPPWK